MSEQDSRADDFPRWLAGQGADAYALAWVGEDNDPLGWMTARAPAVGRTGVDRPGAEPSRLVLQEVTRGRRETLRRWLEGEGDSTDEPLAIIGAADGRLREYTPGELVAPQLRAPGNDDVQLTQELADWVYRRQAQAPQGLEFGWTAAEAEGPDRSPTFGLVTVPVGLYRRRRTTRSTSTSCSAARRTGSATACERAHRRRSRHR
ncbi:MULTISPECIES: hypothetical protein [unclassified Streptomyces]|uniref:hypothetical protein n=1 Tax=unclassified Streptomyces TaxID=2593676 RepID=UPI00093F1F23|nr:hypothetical protein [Streptomyces sp. CB01883]